jgi:hypothetical protein
MFPKKTQFDYSVSRSAPSGIGTVPTTEPKTQYFSDKKSAGTYAKGLAKSGYQSYTAKHDRGGDYSFSNAKPARLTNLANDIRASLSL